MTEKLKGVVNEIAYAHDHRKLPMLPRSLIPLLSLASSLYAVALSLRHRLYRLRFFSTHRLPVPVISVGNLTWGGNGKTPMVQYLATVLADSGIAPLILTRGYGGGDEFKMLERHFLGRPVKIGVGANRAATAAAFFERYGYVDSCNFLSWGTCLDQNLGSLPCSGKIGAVILDDGMQHWTLHRDLELVMINGTMPWGNGQLIPLGPLREPLTALQRADVTVVHHADLVSEEKLKDIKLMIREVKESIPIFFTRMLPSYLFEVGNINSRINLDILNGTVVLCVSAIGSANAFVRGMEKMGAFHVDRFDFSDHHHFQSEDIELIKMKLRELEDNFGSKPTVVVTEKDYDRDPEILRRMSPFKVLVLCSDLQIMTDRGNNADSFKSLLKDLVEKKLRHKLKSDMISHLLTLNDAPIVTKKLDRR